LTLKDVSWGYYGNQKRKMINFCLFIPAEEQNFFRNMKLQFFKKMLYEQDEMETQKRNASESDLSRLGCEHDRCAGGMGTVNKASI
jgi:hypothetical protein